MMPRLQRTSFEGVNFHLGSIGRTAERCLAHLCLQMRCHRHQDKKKDKKQKETVKRFGLNRTIGHEQTLLFAALRGDRASHLSNRNGY